MVRTVRQKRETVDVVYRSQQLNFTVPADYSPGVYRYELEVSKLGGARLARYGQYVRILRPTVKPALSVEATAGADGAELQLQVSNLGTTAISYGKGGPERIERFEDGEWRKVDILDRGRVLRSLRGVTAGRRGPCESVRIAADAPAGRYRVVLKVYPRLAKQARVVRAALRLGRGTYR